MPEGFPDKFAKWVFHNQLSALRTSLSRVS